MCLVDSEVECGSWMVILFILHIKSVHIIADLEAWIHKAQVKEEIILSSFMEYLLNVLPWMILWQILYQNSI